MNPTTLVVGATGHLGSHTAKILARRGHDVRALVRSPDHQIHGAEDLGISYVLGDLGDPESIEAAVAGVDGIVSTANTIIPVANRTGAEDLGAMVSDVLVDAARRHDVERFVLASVPDDDWGNRTVPELAGKRLIEAALENSPLNFTIVRNPAFTDVWTVMCGCLAAQNRDPHATTRRDYGFMKTWLRLTGNLVADRGRLLAFGGADHGAPFVTVNDVAHGLAASVTSPHTKRRTIEFGGPDWVTWNDLAGLYAERLGRPVQAVSLPASFTDAGRAVAKPFSPSASNVLALATFVARSQPAWHAADIVEELGLPAQQNVAHYLDEHLEL